MKNLIARSRWPKAVLAAGLVLGALGSLSGCGGQQRSAAAVCHVWATDAVALHNKYSNDANSGSGLQGFLDVVSVPNDMAVLMDKMGAVAPESIAPDFQAVAKALHDEVANAGQIAADPLGALAGGLVEGLAVSGSEQRIDTFLQQNCAGLPGIPAGGTSGQSSGPGGGSPGQDTTTTTTLAAGCLDPSRGTAASLSKAVDNGTDFQTFTTALSDLQARSSSPISDEIGTLLSQLQAENPPPSSSLEAVARLSWDSVDATGELQAVEKNYEAKCGGSTLFGDVSTLVSNISPFLAGDGVEVSDNTLYGTSCQAPIVEAGFQLVFTCGRQIEVLDGTSGAVAASPAFLPASPNDSSGSQLLGPAVAGPNVGWVTVDVTPSSGLSAPTWSATLHVRTLEGGTVADTPVVPSTTEVAGQAPQLQLVYGGTDGFAVTTADSNGNGITPVQFFDVNGHPIGGPVSLDGTHADPLTIHTAVIGDQLYDFSTHAVVAMLDTGRTNNDQGCMANAVVFTEDSNGNGSYERLTDGTGGPSLRPLSAALDDAYRNGNPQAVYAAGILMSNNDPADFFSWSGRQTWQLTSDSVSKASAILGWVAAQNQSNKAVLVDPATGQQASSLDPNLTQALLDQQSSVQAAFADPVGGKVVVDDGGTYQQYAYRDVCH